MTENANTIVTANYATHAVMWHIVETDQYPSDVCATNAERYYVRNRDGRIAYVWFSIFATYEQMERNYVQTRKFPDTFGESVETVVLTNEGQMGQHVQM